RGGRSLAGRGSEPDLARRPEPLLDSRSPLACYERAATRLSDGSPECAFDFRCTNFMRSSKKYAGDASAGRSTGHANFFVFLGPDPPLRKGARLRLQYPIHVWDRACRLSAANAYLCLPLGQVCRTHREIHLPALARLQVHALEP